MKAIKWTSIGVGILLLLCTGGGYVALRYQAPTYEGELKLKGLHENVEVYFDKFGVPHIYAQNEEDAQFALGYVHAQDRLFQMEMIRRLGRGELAEILGEPLAENDRFFRTIGVLETAKKAAAAFNALPENDPMKKAALAYYEGVNTYVEKGATPVEFQIIGIPKRPFTIEDTYAVFGYMAFSFAQAFQTDPLMMRIYQKYGENYLKDLDMHWNAKAQKIPVWGRNALASSQLSAISIHHILERFPVAPWIGSNSWVIGPQKTKNGKVLFSNDTHMGFAQPSVWYEAHIECPGVSMYGGYLAGVPFSVLGHNRHMAMGLTMLENDDIDFYIEKVNPENPNQLWFKDHWEDMEVREERIKVLGQEDLVFEVKTGRHGPIINEGIESVANTTNQAVSMWWIFNKFLPKNMEALYQFGRANSIDEARSAAAIIHAPGLNGMYGDVDGNIAWWAMGKLPRRPAHVNSKLFLDGSSGEDEVIDFLTFEENPQSENPEVGYIFSANNQPDSSGGILHQGYYIPEDRAKRIVEILESDKKWDLAAAKEMINDVKSSIMLKNTQEIVALLNDGHEFTELQQDARDVLANWDGDNQLEDIAPTIYTKLIYHISSGLFEDELDSADFEILLSTHFFKRTLPLMIANDSSVWWNNVETKDITETRSEVVYKAFLKSIGELESELGADINQWQWQKVHFIEHPHPLGQIDALKYAFSVGPFPVNGNMETINNMMFKLNKDGKYTVIAGPAKRRIIDFADIEHSINVLPTGQSGNVMSEHYADQAQMFVNGEFRLQLMNKEEIVKEGRKLLLKAK